MSADETPSIRTAVRTREDLERLIERLEAVDAASFDVETDSTDPMRANLVGLAIATGTHESFYIPVGHQNEGQLSLDEVRAAIDPLLTDPATKLFAHHGKYDLQVLRRHGFAVDDQGWFLQVTHLGPESPGHRYAGRWWDPELHGTRRYRFVIGTPADGPALVSGAFG